MTVKYEGAKVKVLEERQRFQEERQKLTAQVEELSKIKGAATDALGFLRLREVRASRRSSPSRPS